MMKRRGYRYFVVDVAMVILLVANLVWIVFDWLFDVPALRDLLSSALPAFTAAYAEHIHPNFFFIDMAFVALFLVDFVVGWIVAIVHRVHHRWYFYPFLHWYDLLGCIPLTGFRVLRLLRIVTIFYRLQKAGAVDFSGTAPARLLRKYYAAAVEEVTDRVVIRMLTDVQDEVKHGGPLVERIVEEVFKPARGQLVEWASRRIRTAAGETYAHYRDDINAYIRRRVESAVAHNTALRRLSLVPVVGASLKATARRAMEELVSDVVHGMLEDLVSERNRRLLDEVADLLFAAVLAPEEDDELNRIVADTADAAIEVVKRQVAVQQWKLRDEAADEAEVKRLLREHLSPPSDLPRSGGPRSGGPPED